MKNTLMIDLETTGSVPGCCILTLGAAGRDKNGKPVDFYKRIAHYRSKNDGFLDESKTIDWWQTKDEETRKEAFCGHDNPEDVIKNFYDFIQENFDTSVNNFSVWCKGSDFDFPILKRYFERYGFECPWKFWTQRDYRTLQAVFPFIKQHEKNACKHSALEDAKAQLRGLEYFTSLKAIFKEKPTDISSINKIKVN